MGGKAKQRVKHNAKPSSSSRSAEQMQMRNLPNFDPFASATPEMTKLVQGFTLENFATENFDNNVSSEFQLVLRKMSKKDPLTKKKALNEFIENIKNSDLETCKKIIPLFPRNYKNLSMDPDHMVRELSQSALRTLVSKCKRSVAPFLKQFVPFWLLSQFDNYAPAASIAISSFKETFTGSSDRTQEVLLHCHAEILDHTIRILTYHTASTLSNGKDFAPEEAEQIYQRAVVSSLKALSFLVEKTGSSEDTAKISSDLKSLVENQKFLSLSKTKNSAIRAAWLEFICQVLQSPTYKSIISIKDASFTNLSFQNIDDNDAAVASAAWACALIIQSSYNDWYLLVNLRKSVLPKLSSLMRNDFNSNATTLCTNILPFFSKITPEVLQDLEYFQFCRTFFSDFQHSICNENSRSKTERNAIIKSYFECLRYVFQKLNGTNYPKDDADSFALWLLNDNLIVSIKWFLEGNGIAVKCYFQQVASLVAFWTERIGDGSDKSIEQTINKQLLQQFWQRSFEIIKIAVDHKDVSEACMERVIQFLQDLCSANSNFEGRNIKFYDNESSSETPSKATTNSDCKETTKCSLKNKSIEPKLKQVVIQIVRILIKNIEAHNSSKCIKYIHSLMQLFSDSEFHKDLSDEKTTLASLQTFQNLFNLADEDNEASELIVDIVFGILQNMPITDTLTYLKNMLNEDSQNNIKVLILQRLLSHPYCNEAEVRSILKQPDIRALIIGIAREALYDSTKEKFNILHKCFFQVESNEVLIDRSTVDGILDILCEALFSAETMEAIHSCSSFLAQTMPVFCIGENASKDVKEKVFLHLFEFTIKHLKAEDHIPEETLWEITTSWQDALSSGDIIIGNDVLHSCGQIIQKYADSDSLECDSVDRIATLLAKFIICGTEQIAGNDDKLNRIDEITSVILNSSDVKGYLSNVKDLCTLLEASHCKGSAGTIDLSKNCLKNIQMRNFFKYALLNASIIKKLICKPAASPTQAEDEYIEENCDGNIGLLTEWPPEVLSTVLDYFVIGGLVESFLKNDLYPIDEATEWYLVTLSETLKAIISNDTEMSTILTGKLLDKTMDEQNVSYSRTLQFLVHSPEYAQFEESATIVLEERFSELFVGNGAFGVYVCSLQHLLPNLAPKALTMRSAIMQSEPQEIWIKFVMFRCLIENNFNKVEVNESSDKAIALAALQFITNFIESSQQFNKENFLYNTTVTTKQFLHVNNTVEYINLLCTLVQNFPYQMTLKNWDALRLGLSSWTLSVSKSYSHYCDPKVFLFVTRVFHLYQTFKRYILNEKQKSSTSVIGNVIEEWENLFAREVELVLFNFYFKLCDEYDGNSIDYECFGLLMKHIIPSIELIDYNYVYSSHRDTGKLDLLYSFALKHLSNRLHSIRTCSAHILRELTKFSVAADILTFEKINEVATGDSRFPGSHFLNNFDDYLTRYGMPVRKYLDEFSFKLSEISDFVPVDRDEALSYMFLWDCIIFVCANSPLSLRSIYTSWVHENRYEESYINFLFRCMPVEVLKNHDSKIMSNDLFKGLTFAQIKEPTISIEKLACHLYAETLRKFPAIVRKWWNTCPSRQKTFIDKLTTNFVSPLICNEELKTIANRKEKHENMQVTVHYSTREVLAVYSIDEARMELVITLAPNYPLGSVKLDCGKQIGGRGSSRNIGMQLSIFLTHQNGTICDGLTLWKSNLDKKFDGVEECYICYTVIHHETFRLPKLSCKTCKKKFHGPCLYKWFTTSSKSTCPICRNVF